MISSTHTMIWTEEGHALKKLTALRTARGWSKAELARRARMAEGDIGKIESGRLVPYDTQLRRLARALGVPVAEAASLLDAHEPAVIEQASHDPASSDRRVEPTKR